MGIAKPVIKAHGSSNANAFKMPSVRPKEFVEHDVIGEIQKSLDELEENGAVSCGRDRNERKKN